VTDVDPILFLEPENKKRKHPTHVEEDKRQGSEMLHFPFVTEIFRTIRIQSILKFCISIILKQGSKDFFLLANCTREFFFAKINTRQIEDSFFRQDRVMCFFYYFTFHIISHMCL